MKAYVIQQQLPYRGEPTRSQKVDLYRPELVWATLHEQDMGRPRHREYKKCRPWTEDEEKRLLELRAKGLSLRLTGEALNRGKDEVYRKLKKMAKQEGT